MKILHVSDTYGPTVGGIEVFVHDLAHRQVAQGHDVTILTRGPAIVRDGEGSDVRVIRDARCARAVVAGADTVHAHVSVLSPLAIRAAENAAGTGVPVLATVHSLWTDAWPVVRAVGALRSWNTLPIQWAAVSSAAAGPVSRAVRRQVLVLPNAVDMAMWLPDRPRESAAVTIVAVMRMCRRKRPLQLIAALAHMRERLPAHVPVRAVLVGEGPLLGSVRRAIRLAGLDWVEAVGGLPREQIAQLYRRANIFVAPATMESFGIAALEARAAGLAVVARAGTGVEEFVQDGVDGYLVHSDVAAAERLVELCADRVLLDRIQDHNTEVVPPFGWADALWQNKMAYASAASIAGATAQHPLSRPDLAFEV